MRRNIWTRLASMAMAVIATFAFVCPALAVGADGNKVLLTRELALEIAQNFADSLDDSGSIEASDATQLYDESGQAIGCIIDYVSAEDGSPHGYIVLDNTDESLVEEYSLDAGAISPYAMAKKMAAAQGIARAPGATSSEQQGDSLIAVKTSPYSYAAVVPGSSSGVSQTGVVMRVPSMSSAKDPSTWSDIFIDDARNGKYQILSENYYGEQPFTYSEDEVTSQTGRYACAVTAMTEVAASYLGIDFYDQSFSTTYNMLWSLSGTTVYKTDKDSSGREIAYGSTENKNIGPALKSFMEMLNHPISYRNGWNPSFSDFTSTTDSQNASIVSLGINFRNSDGTISREGHSMAVFGYLTITDNANGGVTQILVVADGWNYPLRYLNYSYSKYTDRYGTHFARTQ